MNIDQQYLAIMLRHLRDHYWCLVEQQHEDETLDVRDALEEVTFVLSKYDLLFEPKEL